jgi:hypothetical protein
MEQAGVALARSALAEIQRGLANFRVSSAAAANERLGPNLTPLPRRVHPSRA